MHTTSNSAPTNTTPNDTASHPVPADVFATIAATVATLFGKGARISSIQAGAVILLDPQLFHWSLEGRRLIYSSHRVR
jgi:hypothetical protein